MFLPTKSHTKDIVEGQHKIRLGNRVPKDAVNLAYTHVPAINSRENVLVTDLSNTILENTRNTEPINIDMYPDQSLVLQADDEQIEVPTEDILMTNVFKDDVPLYYSHQLAYHHYDEQGPDEYGIYNREGIAIIDKNGQPITRPYQIQLIADPNHLNLYHVFIYTSFKDKESDSYQVVYNAVVVQPDGIRKTIAGYRETLNLNQAFDRTYNIGDIIELINKKEIFPTYYQANGINPGYNKFYIPVPRIKDTREYQKFRYQVAAEVETKKDRFVFATPWRSNSVLNANFLNKMEESSYENGYKQITEKTAQEILDQYIPFEYKDDPYTTIRYFVKIDNPRVEEFLRTDGSSPLFVTTTVGDESNILSIPKDVKVIKSPVPLSSEITFRARPIMGRDDERAYVSFVIDNSESMGTNDPEKTLRLQMLEALLVSVRSYYSKNVMNGWCFNKRLFPIQEEFKVGDIALAEAYSKSVIDNDITAPVPAIDEAMNALDAVPDTDANPSFTILNRKFIVLISDGQFDSIQEIETKLQEAQTKNIRFAIICFNNVPILKELVKNYNAVCIDASSPRLMMELRYFFFNMAGLHDSIDLGITLPFTMDPQDNELLLETVRNGDFAFPAEVLESTHRYGLEAVLKDDPWMPELAIYFKEVATGIIEPSYNGADLITLDHLMKYSGYELYAHSEAWQFYYAPKFSVQYNDTQKIKVLQPRQIDGNSSWYPRIKNGRFERTTGENNQPVVYQYSIPEYYRQKFMPDMGFPYKKIRNEHPEVLNETTIRVTCTPLFVQFNGEDVTNVKVTVNGKPMRIKSWASFSGMIELDGAITRNDEIYVDYIYEEDSFEYRGYYNAEDDHFWALDLNPSKGHFSTIIDPLDGEIKEVPSFSLLNKIVYIYLKPSTKITLDEDGNELPSEVIATSTIFHTFEKIQDTRAVLLAEIRVRPNSNQSNIELIDTRVRGGGLKKEITKAIMQEFEAESVHYWDIGYWDGEPYPENAVVSIRLTRSVLKEYGGTFTRPEIEEKLEKYLGYGVLPIIEFIDDPDTLLQIPEDLVVDVVDVEDSTTSLEKPTFRLTLEG